MGEIVTVKVAGVPHDGILRGSLTYGAEDAVRRATLEVVEVKGARRFWPKEEVEIFAGADLVLKGQVKKISPRIKKGDGNTTVTVESKSAKAVKTAAQAPDYALKKKSVGDAAKALFGKVGVSVKDEAGGKAFNWKWAPGEKAFAVVEKQARAANLLLMGEADGSVAIAKGIRGRHAGFLGVPGEIIEGHADLGSDNDHSETVALGQKRDGDKKDSLRPKATARNAAGDGTVNILLNETEFDAQDLTARARARRDRRRGADASCTLTVPRWRDDAGKLWSPAFEIPVSAMDDLALEQDMAIKTVTLRWAKGEGGESAEINMVDPPALNGKKGKSKSNKAWSGDTSQPKYEEDE